MYAAHFGLRELPFGITPDTSFFFGSAGSQEALNTLLVAARSGEGFIKITGEVGTGKTLLCRKFMATLGEGFVTAYIPNPYLEPRTLMLALADELEIVLERDVDQHQLLKAINLRLLDLAGQDLRVVLCLDEAQAIPVESLEALRLLTNLETEQHKLLQVVLFGQPELDATLARHEFRQLRQRITFAYRLRPLDVTDTGRYLQERLSVAGYRGEPLFSPAAVRLLVRGSGGIPRLLNILGNKALMATYGEGRRQVGVAQVRRALADTDGAPSLLQSVPSWLRWSLAASALVLLVLGAWPWLAPLRELWS